MKDSSRPELALLTRELVLLEGFRMFFLFTLCGAPLIGLPGRASSFFLNVFERFPLSVLD